MAKIYLSSTFEDLAAHRQAVYRVLRKMRHDVISMEDYTASGRPPLEKCLADVAECDLYVGIFAWRYGYLPPGHDQAITELELREAERCGKQRLIFILDADAPWKASLIDADRSRIERLRSELERDYLVQRFRSPEDLSIAVSVAISNQQLEGAPAAADAGLPDAGTRSFYRNCLARMVDELAVQIRWNFSSVLGLVVIGGAVAAVAAAHSSWPLLALAALPPAVTVYPIGTLIASRGKRSLLQSYLDELGRDDPAREAVLQVGRFLSTQLKVEAFP